MAKKPMMTVRNLHLRQATGTIRVAQYQDRDHLVVPVVALVEGVIWPVNSKVPELVLASEFSIAPSGWNGRPVFCGHPISDEGEHVFGNTPKLLEEQSIGTVFNAKIVNNQLTMEAWIDPLRCEVVGGEAVKLLQRIRDGEMIEISVGTIVASETNPGFYGQKRYVEIWRHITPDHLALLPEGDVGACSISMGCGTPRAATVYIPTAEGFMAAKKKKQTEKGKALLDGVTALLEKTRTLLGEQEAAEEAAELVQYNTLATLLGQTQTTITEASSVVAQLIADETEDPTESRSEEEAEETVESARLDALYALTGSAVDLLYRVMNLCYECQMAHEPEEYPRYAKGARNSKIDSKTIQSVHDNAVALGAACAEGKAAAGHVCSKCSAQSQPSQGEGDMDKKARIAALMSNKHNMLKDEAALTAASDTTLTALEKHCQDAAAAETKAAEEAEAKRVADEKVAKEKAAQAAKTPAQQEQEYLDNAPASIRTLVTRQKNAEAARRTELVTKLKTAQSAYTEAELTAMDLDQLEKVAQLAKLEVASAPMDYSGRSLPRQSEEAPTVAPDPPSLVEAIKANAAASNGRSSATR